VAVASYQNPLEYQMYSAFEQKEEDTIQPEIKTTSALQPAQTIQERPAAAILKGVGITSAKDVLKTLPDYAIEKDGQGITASKILEDYRKEQELATGQKLASSIAAKAKTDAFNQSMQQEAELRKKEADYIKNYSIDLTKKSYSYNTKFGVADFNPTKVSVLHNPLAKFEAPKDGKLDHESFGSLLLGVETEAAGKKVKEDYMFIPFEYIAKGTPEGFQNRKVHTAFLNKETWDAMLQVAQPVNLTDSGKFSNFFTKKEESLNEGYLFKYNDYIKFHDEYLYNQQKPNNRFIDAYNYSAIEGFDASVFNTPILGIANLDGNLVYVRDNSKIGTTQYYDVYIGADGRTNATYYTPPKDRGGVLGVVQDVGKAVAKIPFAPEIIGVATGNPYVYASLKSLQTLGAGGSSSDVLLSAGAAFATASIAPKINVYGESLGASINAATGGAMSTTVANTIGTAVVSASVNGVVAAATKQDVGDAMLAGAIGGGLSANAASITNSVFGGEANVTALSKTLNLTVPQTQSIFTSAIAAGSINAVVKNEDFLDAFTESLLVQGVSQSGANTVKNQLSSTLDPKAREAIVSNTRIFLQASARAAVRGEDMETAIKRVAPYLQGRAIGQTANILLNKN